MRTAFLSLSLWLLLAAGSGAAAQDPSARPNIVILLADDMGYSDIGCYGSEIATPNLDRLAAGGLRFTQFYNTARCCPTRAALLTGLYSHQAGVGHMVEGKAAPGYLGYLNDRCVTFAEALRPAGYFTAMAGKWHVGEKRPHWPVDRGFDRYYGLISGGSNYFKIDSGRTLALDGEHTDAAGDDFYLTDAFTDYSLKFLDEAKAKKKPFILYTAFTSPHWPLHARPEEIAKYRGKYQDGWDALRAKRHRRMIELGIVDATWPLTPRDPKAPAWEDTKDKDELDLRMAVYAAQIDRMDQNIGRILAKLRETGAEENTLVLFLSDNGGCAEEIHRGKPGAAIGTRDSFESYGLPWANASNTPFRLFKHWVHEGGIATPLIASWPAVIKKGAIIHEPGHLIDILPTCLELAKAEYPKGKTPVEGLSLVPLLREGRRTGHDAIFWEHEGNRAVRQGKWKLVARHKAEWELYDLEADRTELKNLAAANPDRVKELAAKHDAWAARVGVVSWDELNRRK
jgi:arylsulfatase